MKMLQRVWSAFHAQRNHDQDARVLISDRLLSSLSGYEDASDDERVRLFVTLAHEIYDQGRNHGFSAGYQQRIADEREHAAERDDLLYDLPELSDRE